MKESIYVVYQSSEYLKEHFFEDIDGCFWEFQQDKNNYDREEYLELNYRIDDNGSKSFHPKFCGKIVEKHIYDEAIRWAVKEEITRSQDPEYFL